VLNVRVAVYIHPVLQSQDVNLYNKQKRELQLLKNAPFQISLIFMAITGKLKGGNPMRNAVRIINTRF
jgi:hypothetical protein